MILSRCRTPILEVTVLARPRKTVSDVKVILARPKKTGSDAGDSPSFPDLGITKNKSRSVIKYIRVVHLLINLFLCNGLSENFFRRGAIQTRLINISSGIVRSS